MVIPRWELHIRQMFNLHDWAHMTFKFDATDINSVWNSRNTILLRAKSPTPMPPSEEHGPWPEEWIGLFERWIAVGESEFGGNPPRLTIGQGSDYRIVAGFAGWTVEGKAALPSSATKAWLQLTAITDSSQTVVLHTALPPQLVGGPVQRTVKTKINPTPQLQEIIVVDVNGETRLPRPGPGS